MTASERQTVQALLAWQAAMGADEAIGEMPFDCFARPPAAPAPPPRVTPKPQPPASSSRASVNPAAATTLAEIEAMVANYDGCPLKRTANRLCFARGCENAPVMLIGEAPGREEDLEGKPFVGPAGRFLDLMLAAIGIGEDQVYITNTVYWRPPGNRTPTPEELEACAPFVARQIELLSPQVLVLLGRPAAQSVLRVGDGILRLRGKWLSYSCAGREIPTLATLHPAYLLRQPAEKRLAWRDLLMLKEKLAQL